MNSACLTYLKSADDVLLDTLQTHHPLKKRKNDPKTCSHAAKPPFGGGPGSEVLSTVVFAAVVGASIFASASSASSTAESLLVTVVAAKS
jgi:hypothetical protein